MIATTAHTQLFNNIYNYFIIVLLLLLVLSSSCDQSNYHYSIADDNINNNSNNTTVTTRTSTSKEQQQSQLHYHPPLYQYNNHNDNINYRLLKQSIHPKLGSLLTNLIIHTTTYDTTTDSNSNNNNNNSNDRFIRTGSSSTDIVDRYNSNSNSHNKNDRRVLLNNDYYNISATTSSNYFIHNNNNMIKTIHNTNNGTTTVLVDVIGNGLVQDMSFALYNDGYTLSSIINCYSIYNICSMYVSIHQLYNLSNLDYIQLIRPVIYNYHSNAPIPILSSSTTTTTDDDNDTNNNNNNTLFLDVDAIRSTYNVNGSGIVIGILSDSFNCYNGLQSNIRRNDLPSSINSITIVSDLNSNECIAYNATDRGRTLMILLYSIAPGARFVFRTVLRGQGDFIYGINELVTKYNCNILLDDVLYSNEPFYQDGIITQMIDTIVIQYNIFYFSSITHNATTSWDSTGNDGFVSSGIYNEYNDEYHMFSTDPNTGEPIISQFITIPNNINVNITFIFQWSEPFVMSSSLSSSLSGGSQSDMDIYFLVNGIVIACGIDTNIGMDPIEIVEINPSFVSSSLFNKDDYDNDNDESISIRMQIVLHDGIPPRHMKVIAIPDMTNVTITFEFGSRSSSSSTIFGHANSMYGASVGAVGLSSSSNTSNNMNNVEVYTSFGGTPILFDNDGNVLLSNPRAGKINPTLNDFITRNRRRFPKNTTPKPRIGPSSIAAATVAGIVALILESLGGPKSILPQQIYTILENTAFDIDNTSSSSLSYNDIDLSFINAFAAFQAVGAKPKNGNMTNTTTILPTQSPTTTTTTNQCRIFGLFPFFCLFRNKNGGCNGFFQRLLRIGKC